MKKPLILILAALVFATTSMVRTEGPSAPDKKMFEELFKGVDFEKLLKEVETALEKVDIEKDGQPGTPITTPQKPGSWLPPFAKETMVIKQPVTGKKDRRSLVLDPTVQTVTPAKGQASTTIPTDESFYAYQGFMDDFLNHLTSIDTKVTASKNFSPAFKEAFSEYCQTIIDAIIVAHENIESKKIYTKVFLAPPETNKKLFADMKRLRKMIVDASDATKKLDGQITVQAEEKETEEITHLRNLAEQRKAEQKKAQPQQSPRIPLVPEK